LIKIIRMKLFSLFLFIYFSISSLGAQTTGFFGKKNLLEISVIGQIPALYNFNISRIGQPAYRFKNGVLKQGAPLLSTGFRWSIGRVLQRNFAVYFEGGVNNLKVVPSIGSGMGGLGNVYFFDLKGEMLAVRSISLLPKIEITTPDGLLPIGISNQFGIGVNTYKVLAKEYRGTVRQIDPFGQESTVNISENNYFNYANKVIKGYTFLYKLSMRIPLNEYFLYHFGFRYTYHYTPFSSDYRFLDTGIVSQEDAWEAIKRKQTRNLINFEMGLAFSF
jgi:hypothetical protein